MNVVAIVKMMSFHTSPLLNNMPFNKNCFNEKSICVEKILAQKLLKEFPTESWNERSLLRLLEKLKTTVQMMIRAWRKTTCILSFQCILGVRALDPLEASALGGNTPSPYGKVRYSQVA